MTNNTFNYKLYKKRLPHKPKFLFYLTCLMFVLTIGFALYFKPTSSKKYELYFVEVGSFQTYNDAANLAAEIKAQGAAGNIYFENKYRVLACHYNQKKEAESVAKNLQTTYKNACVFTLKTNKISIPKSLSKQQKDGVSNLLILTLNAVQTLSSLSLSLDTNNLTLSKLKISIKDLQISFETEFLNFKNLFNTNSKYNVAKSYLNNINKNLSILNAFSTKQEFNEHFKFFVIDCCINFNSFASCFS